MVELGLAKLTEDSWLVDLFSVLSGLLDVVQVVKDDSDGFNWLVDLLVDAEGFIVEAVLGILGKLSEFHAVVLVQLVDVIHDSSWIGLDGSQDQQVLKACILSEVGVVQNDAFEQLNQMLWKLSVDESLDSDRNFVDIFGLRQGSLDNLLNYVLSVRVLRVKNLGPKCGLLAFNQVAGLSSVQVCLVCDLNELVVTLAPGSLVGSEG